MAAASTLAPAAMPTTPDKGRLVLMGASLATPWPPTPEGCIPFAADTLEQLPPLHADDLLLCHADWLLQLPPSQQTRLAALASPAAIWAAIALQETTALQRLALQRLGLTHLLEAPEATVGIALLWQALVDPAPDETLRILILDNARQQMAAVAAELSGPGLRTETVRDLDALLIARRNFEPDLILATATPDECTPGELLGLIRQGPSTLEQTVLFLGPDLDLHSHRQIAVAGGELLVQPASPTDLLPLITARASNKRRDRRQRMRQDAQLNHERQQLHRLRTAIDAHAIVSVTNAAGTITEVNERFCEISGYPREQLVGHNHRLLKSGRHGKETYDHLWQQISSGQVWQGEICNRRRNGEEYWVEATIVPILDPNGVPECYISIRTDVTTLKRQERALQDSEERLRISQKFANIGTWDWNIQTGELFWSERIAPLFGHASGTLATSYANFIAAVHPDDREALQQAVQRSLEQNETYDIEHRVVWPNGEIRWLQERGAAVRAPDGTPLRMLGVVQDIHARKVAELALIERESELREAHELARLGNWQADLGTGELRWSEQIYRIYGQDPNHFRPTLDTVHAAVHPDDLARVLESEQLAGQSGLHEIVHRIVLPNGTVRHVHERARPAFDDDGLLAGLKGTVQDVSQLIETEARLRESEARFSFAVEGAGDGIWDWDLSSGQFQASRISLEMLGYADGELLSHVNTWRDLTHPDDRERAEIGLREYFSGEVEHFAVEVRLLCKDGHYKWVLCRATAVAYEQGMPTRLVGIHTDITRQKQIEDNLMLFRRVFNASQQCIAVADASGRVIFVNEAYSRTMGFGADEVLGRDFRAFAAVDDTANEIRRAIIEEHRPWSGMTRRRRKDGSEFVAYNNYGFVDDEAGAVQFFFVIFSDFTEELAKRAELASAKESAERANQAKSDFLSSMSHELRTPMNAIIGFAQVLEYDDHLGEEQLDSVHEILKAGRHLLDLINEVLDLARIESGRLMLSIEPVQLHDVVADCRQLIQPLASTRHVQLLLEAAPDGASPWLCADRVRLKQVLLNLLSNAVKYNREGGSVRLQANLLDNGQVRVAVTDDGPGIPAHKQGELFQPFSRLGAEESGVEGTGIGLTITRRLVEMMGGEIGVHSAEGKGATFWFDLPAERAAATEGQGELASADPAAPGALRANILCVDDNPTNLKLVTQLLARRGNTHLTTAHTPELGLELALASHPDLILLDINMPRMDGYQVLQILRADSRLATVPVIAVTASAMPRDVERGLSAGFAAYLTKPLDVEQFLQTIDHCLIHPGN